MFASWLLLLLYSLRVLAYISYLTIPGLSSLFHTTVKLGYYKTNFCIAPNTVPHIQDMLGNCKLDIYQLIVVWLSTKQVQ